MPCDTNASTEVDHLFKDYKWQQIIGRPKNQKEKMFRIFLNAVFVMNLIRLAVLMWWPGEEKNRYLGNLMQSLGYNNSQMFFVTAVSYGIAVSTFLLVFSLAEYKGRKEFMDDISDLGNKAKEWNLSSEDQAKIKTTAIVIIKVCKVMIPMSGGVCYVILFLALVLKMSQTDSFTERVVLAFWYLFVISFCQRAVSVFYFVIMMQFISVQALRLRYKSLGRKLLEAKTDQDIIRFMDEHDQISTSCRAYNQSFKWMISAMNDLSTPAVAVTVYNVVYSNFTSLFEQINAYVFCSLLITSTLMIVFIPCGTARKSQAAYPALMSVGCRFRLSRTTRRRLLNFCKRISIQTIGHVGFSNGSTATFTESTAFENVFATITFWFLYATIKQNL